MPNKAKLHSQRVLLHASLFAICLLAIFSPASPLSMKAGSLTELSSEQRSQLPMFFVENRGQIDARVRFLMKRSGFTAYFLDGEIILSISGKSLPIRLVGANAHAPIEGGELVPGKANFFVGNSPEKWRTDLPLHGSIVYRNSWPGIDMVYSSTGRKLKSEFRVAAKADPDAIRWNYGPKAPVRVNPDGSLGIQVNGDELREEAPEIYQERAGKRELVSGSFRVLANGDVGFNLGSYDRTLPLVIDPVVTYSTFVGGTGQDSATAIATDLSGNPVIVGFTTSTDLPVLNAPKPHGGGGVDAFVAKMSAYGNQVVYCTYLGGSGDDRAFGVAVDRSGNAYVTGWTGSVNFPVTGPLQAKLAGARDAFVTKLNAAGNTLLYSTYLGGSDYDSGNAIAVDGTGSAYITGDTSSLNFPVLGAFQAAKAGQQDAFVAKLNPAGTALSYSTYLGGSRDDHGAGIAVDASGNAYVTGGTLSKNFPVANALQPTSGGNQDAFVTKLGPSGRTLIYSTYLGGSGGTAGRPETGNGIAVDPLGSAYVAGVTSSANFPASAGAYQGASGGGNTDGFVAKLNPAGSALVYSTYFGGSSVDSVTAIALDLAGNAYITGNTASLDFPTLRAYQTGNRGMYNAFIAKLYSAGSGLIYSTYMGGSDSDSGNGIAVDYLGNALMCGAASSSDFPALTEERGISNAFVAKIVSGWLPIVVHNGNWAIDYLHNSGYDGQNYSYGGLSFGASGDAPVVGDWTGTGSFKAGVFRNGVWFLDWNGNGSFDGVAGGDRSFTFGQAGDIPVVGDWDGTGTVKAGYYRNGAFTLDLSGHLQGKPTGKSDLTFSFGNAGDQPVVGDWNNSGTTKIGVFRNGLWFLDTTGNMVLDSRAHAFTYGQAGDIPLVGDWDGSGSPRPGVFRGGQWILDYNGNFQMDALGTADLGFYFGAPGFYPMVTK
ncbi:MAG: SBBP repeat-containing protein [Acidobacteriota bacterium]|nr:SBBP repeat-containing protein [Acidobacteriota bacterium]